MPARRALKAFQTGVCSRRMSDHVFTLIDDGRPVDVDVELRGDQVWLSARALEHGLGWELTPDGLCRDGLCVPRRGGATDVNGIGLAELATVLGRSLAVDVPERAAYLGAAAVDRAGALTSLMAPDFSLPDLQGRLHSLSEHRGKKVFLVAYASW
jgi:hypothetical protein